MSVKHASVYRRRHEQFCLVEGRWMVLGMTYCHRGQFVWRCRLYERVGNCECLVASSRYIGTRIHAERRAQQMIAEQRSREGVYV